MDRRAKDCATQQHNEDRSQEAPLFLYEKWSFNIDGVKQTQFDTDAIYEHVYGPKILARIHRKDGVPLDTTKVL